jgi:hypothetical protein
LEVGLAAGLAAALAFGASSEPSESPSPDDDEELFALAAGAFLTAFFTSGTDCSEEEPSESESELELSFFFLAGTTAFSATFLALLLLALLLALFALAPDSARALLAITVFLAGASEELLSLSSSESEDELAAFFFFFSASFLARAAAFFFSSSFCSLFFASFLSVFCNEQVRLDKYQNYRGKQLIKNAHVQSVIGLKKVRHLRKKNI